jgi:hypothetical protein
MNFFKFFSSKLEYSKSSNKQSSTTGTDIPTQIGTTQNNITSLMHNNTVAGLSLSNISHSPSIDRDVSGPYKLSCCIENCNRLGDKIINFLKEKGIVGERENYNDDNNSHTHTLLSELKNLIRIEILKIPIKPKIKNLSNITEVVTENFTCNKNSPQQEDIGTTPNFHPITDTNLNNLNTTITDEQNKNAQIKPNLQNEKNLLNINSLNSQSSSNIQNPIQESTGSTEPHKIINNIKQIIQKNKNSRNHKDIIHEDYHTDSDKYNLNHLGKSNSNSTNTQNMISDTYYKNSIVSRMTEAERQSLKSLLQQNKGVNNINSGNKDLRGKNLNNFSNLNNHLANKFNFKPSENLARAINRNTRNNNIQNGNKFAHLLSLNTSSIKKKVKSFSPSYKNNVTGTLGSSVGKKPQVQQGTHPSQSKEKSLSVKTNKHSYDYAKKNAARNEFRTRNDKNRILTENSTSASKIKNLNSTLNTSDLKSIKKSLNLSEIYSKIISLNACNAGNKNLMPKNFYPTNEKNNQENSSSKERVDNENEKNLRYMNTEAIEREQSSLSPKRENNKKIENNPNSRNIHVQVQNLPTTKTTLVNNLKSVPITGGTNFEKYKNSKLAKNNSTQNSGNLIQLPKHNTINNINTSYMGSKNLSKSKFLNSGNKSTKISDNKNQLINSRNTNSKSIQGIDPTGLNATYHYPSGKGQTMIFNNNFFNNVNNYTSNINILKENLNTTSPNNEKASRSNQSKQERQSIPIQESEELLINKNSSKDLMKEIKNNLDDNLIYFRM